MPENNTIGVSNSFFGTDAGRDHTTGGNNSFFGTYSGLRTTTGVSNSFFGAFTGSENTTGRFNSFFGLNSGSNNTTGSENCFFGRDSGSNLTTGSNNIVIGRGAGPTTANNSISNRLYIDVISANSSGNDNPLIYGEFDNDFVRINGTFEVTAGLTNPSSIKLKDRFATVAPMLVLDKINQLDISEWSYKHDPEVRHIGPTAESFYEAFGLGTGGDNISTIDADGVSLIAIQALTEQLLVKDQEIIELQDDIATQRLNLEQKDQKIVELEERLSLIESMLLDHKK